MKQSVYLETTIISYLTARPAQDPIVLGRQILTKEWWQKRKDAFMIVLSDLVLQEIQAGDSEAARRRLKLASGIPSLPISNESVTLAELLVNKGPIPTEYPEDALHVALCAVHDIDFLLTWNCSHLANAVLRYDLESVVSNAGFNCPVICTPEELMEPEI
ncbi:MAG TPA: type II toxin-antitoxin system VapC family toxin [Candidatus Hydrogenedentes bacterium]|nr:type II toxin-antitoxin system VapC family toxin [Candidatus Hydrogenedentota bacterium]